MSYNKILSDIGLSTKILPNNIILSDKSFFKDIEEGNMCLYRGSTSAITALQNGTLPIYLNDDKSINIDPLFGLKKVEKINCRPKRF